MDADEARVSRYNEALRAVPGVPASAHFHGEFTDNDGNHIAYVGDGAIFEDYARAVIAVADEEQAELRAEVERLRVRVHEVVDEQQRRFAPYVSRCDRFDLIKKWATEYMPVDWSHQSEAVRTVFMAERERAETAEAELQRRRADASEA